MQLHLIRLTAEKSYIGTTQTHMQKIERGGGVGTDATLKACQKNEWEELGGKGATRAGLEPCLVEQYREDQAHSEIFLGQTRA